MQPRILKCRPRLGSRWHELATRNGMVVQLSDTGFVIQHENETHDVPVRKDPDGNFRININQINEVSLLSRVELMSFASGATCATWLAPVEFDYPFRCPRGFSLRWRDAVTLVDVTSMPRRDKEGDSCVAEGRVRIGDAAVSFITGAAFDESQLGFIEFIALASHFPLFKKARNRFNESFQEHIAWILGLGGQRLFFDDRG